MFQTAHYALSNIRKINPLLYYSTKSFWANGYNYVTSTDNRYVPDKINAIHNSGDISHNFNIMLIVIYVVLFTGMVLYLISYIFNRFSTKKKVSLKIQSWAIHIFKEYFLTINLFCSISIGFSVGAQIAFGTFSVINTLICSLSIVSLFACEIILIYSNTS